MSNLDKLDQANIDYYVLVEDGDGHSFAVKNKDVNRANSIFEKDWDDWSEEDQYFIDSLIQVDGDDYVIVLTGELNV